MKRRLAIAASLLLVHAAAACGGGEQEARQEGEASAGATEAPESAVQVSDAELESFIRASLQLEDFQAEMRTRMADAAGTEQRAKVRKQLMEERDSIIEAAGLPSPARYDTIMQSLKDSQSLRKRYTALRDSLEAARADTAP